MDAAVRAGIEPRTSCGSTSCPRSCRAWRACSTSSRPGRATSPPSGSNLELFAIAAVIIGGASLNGGKGRILASAVGVLMLAFMDNGLTLSGVEPFYRYIAVGVILVVAVVVDQLFPDLF